MNLYALFTLGYTDEAHAFMGWLERTTAGRAEDLQLMYGVGGERLPPELELDGLDGYRDSRPVRVGNAAAGQFQLDVYGYLLDTAWLYHRHGGRRHFVASKVIAWVAVDRAIRLARARGLPADLGRWTALRRAIRRIEQAGVDPATGAFTQAFDSQALDAANLLLPLVRFLPPDDPRIRVTVERTARELAPHGLVHRHLDADDGLPGDEASFVICSFWLVDNLALARPHRTGPGAVRAAPRPRQRPRPPGRGDRPGRRRTARQLPPGLQPRRAHQRRRQPRPQPPNSAGLAARPLR
jgi:GH15 family glucan-1,4-alpha-glucosidase